MSIAEWRQVQELFGRMSEQEKAFLALKGLYDELLVRMDEAEVRLDEMSKPKTPSMAHIAAARR